LGKFISLLNHAFFISFSLLLGLLLCDFYMYLEIKKGVIRLIIVLCLCPGILQNIRMQDLDHVIRRKNLGAADILHPADMSHYMLKGVVMTCQFVAFTIVWKSALRCFVHWQI
jgi:hypothetical protein